MALLRRHEGQLQNIDVISDGTKLELRVRVGP